MEDQSLSQFLSPSLLEFTWSNPAKVLDDICEQEFDAWLANLPEFPATEGKNIDDSDAKNDMFTGSGLSADWNFAVVSSGELKRLQEKNSNKNTVKSTVTWLNGGGLSEIFPTS